MLQTLPVAQSAMNVCVCLRTNATLSLGRGSLRMMCSIKSLGMTEAMFHFNFPSTTSSQSWKIEKEKILKFCSNSVSWQKSIYSESQWACCHASIDHEIHQSDPIPRTWLCKKSKTFPLYPSSLYLIICMPFSFLASFVFISWHVTSFALFRDPANETARSFLPVTSLKQPQWACTEQTPCTSKEGTRLLWFNFLCALCQSEDFANSLMF